MDAYFKVYDQSGIFIKNVTPKDPLSEGEYLSDVSLLQKINGTNQSREHFPAFSLPTPVIAEFYPALASFLPLFDPCPHPCRPP